MSLPETGFVRLKQILEIFPVSKSQWYAGVAAHKYPPGYKLGKRTTAWRVEDIKRLLQEVAK